MVKLERNAREFLSDLRVWVGIAYFAIAFTLVGLYVVFGRQAHEETIRTATARAAATTQVGQCFTAARNAPVTEGFLDAHEAIIDNGIAANRAALNLSPRNDPLRPVREESLVRLEKAKDNADQLRRLILAMTPTISKCTTLAHRLGVDATRYTRRNP